MVLSRVEKSTQYSLQLAGDADAQEGDLMLNLDVHEIEAEAVTGAGEKGAFDLPGDEPGARAGARDDDSVESALARALSFEDNAAVGMSARSNGSHNSSSNAGAAGGASSSNPKLCARCEELKREMGKLKQHIVLVEEHLNKLRAGARAGDASPLTVVTQGSLGSLEAVDASFYDVVAVTSVHEPPTLDMLGNHDDDRSQRSNKSNREAIQTDELDDEENEEKGHTPPKQAPLGHGTLSAASAGVGGGHGSAPVSPLSPHANHGAVGSALGGNFSVLSASYASMDKELLRPVVSYKGSDGQKTFSSRPVGIEGAQGSLDLLSEYGLAHSGGGGGVIGITSTASATKVTDGHNMHLEAALNNALDDPDSSLREGDSLLKSNLTRADQKKLNKLLEQHARAEKEAMDKILSLEFQNVELADKLRSKNYEKGHAEKLHSLQLMERGILLKELARQVNELKTRLAIEKKKNGPEPREPTHRSGLPVPDVNVRRRAQEENARAKTPVVLAQGLITETIDASKPEEGNGNVSYSRLLAASASMPFLSDDYGTYRQASNLNSRTGSREAASENFAASGRITSPHNTSRGKNISSGKINFLPDIMNNTEVQVSSDVAALKEYSSLKQQGLGSTAGSGTNTQKMGELSDIRKKIVTILSERYPAPSAEQLLAVDKAKKRALDQREMELKAKAARKAAEKEHDKTVRARAKPKRIRPEEDDW